MNFCLAIVLVVMAGTTSAAELKHPASRDEDIAGATVSSTVSRLPDGKYRYVYTVRNASRASAILKHFKLDVHCSNMPKGPKKYIPDNGFTQDGNYSMDSRHVPLVSELVGLNHRVADIMPDNVFQTMIGLGQGDERVVAVTSPNRPGYVYFVLDLTKENDQYYDYYVEEDGETHWKYDMDGMPWYEDWEVHGLVKGPACAGEEATPVTRAVFPGQKTPGEHRHTNALLTYEIPGNRNRWYAPPAQTDVTFVIHYADGINPETFKATLNGQDIRSRFKPIPLTSEKITLPLNGARTAFELSVEPRADVRMEEEIWANSGEPGRIDVDPFVIRRQLPTTP